MTNSQIKAKISEYEQILEKSQNEPEKQFCLKKIAGLKELIKSSKKPTVKAVTVKAVTVKAVNDFDIDFDNYKVSEKVKNAKKSQLQKSVIDEFTDLFN
jgi:hypothetical protein